MSYALEPVKTFVVLDPRTSLYRERSYAILKGARQVSWQQVTASSGTSTSSLVWSAPPPNSGFIVDSKFYVRCFVQGAFSGTSTGAKLLQPGTGDGFRQLPINSCINVTSHTLNNGAFSTNTDEILPALWNLAGNKDEFDGAYSMSPCMPDQYQNYGDWQGSALSVGAPFPPGSSLSFMGSGSNRNPLSFWGENAAEMNRGGFPYVINTNTPTTATISATLTEPLFNSPLRWGSKLNPGFIGVSAINVQLTMDSLSRMWSHDALVGPSTGPYPIVSTFTFSNAPQLLFQYLTPQLTPSIPKQIPYPYTKITYNVTPGLTLAPNTSATVTTNSIQYGSIPKLLVFVVQISKSARGISTSDSFAGITNLNLFFNGQAGLMASATQQDLWKMSRENGLQLDWAAFSKYRGSVVCVAPGKDLGLDQTMAPGLASQITLQSTITFTNLNGTQTLPLDVYTIALEEGVVSLAEQNAVTQVAILSPLDIVNSKDAPLVDYSQVQQYFGGGLGGGDDGILSGIRSALGKAAELVPGLKAENILPCAVDVASRVPGPIGLAASAAKSFLGVGGGKKRKIMGGDMEDDYSMGLKGALAPSGEEMRARAVIPAEMRGVDPSYEAAIEELGREIKSVAAAQTAAVAPPSISKGARASRRLKKVSASDL